LTSFGKDVSVIFRSGFNSGKVRSAGILLAMFTSGSVALAKPKAAALKTDQEKISYLLGTQVGGSIKSRGVEDLKQDAFMRGLEEAMKGTPSAIPAAEAEKLMNGFFTALKEKEDAKNKAAGEASAKEGKTFLEANAKKPGVQKTASGLQYKVIKEGKGDKAKSTDTVTVHYKGTLINGKEFDSSYKRNQPASFPLGGVIKGWTEGLQLMNPGAKFEFYIPSDLAYGDKGAPPDIPPQATLIFEVELISIGAPAAK
jgi:FKBP-type peptidyl-prolyl cis-trans isomerase